MKKRMGASPLDAIFTPTAPAPAAPKSKPEPSPSSKPSKARPAARARAAADSQAAAAEKLREDYKAGRATNYYVSKSGAVYQKILVYLPFELVRELKKEAIDARLSLSGLIQKRLGG
jgi:transglutaminase-like putative cysteine protease